MARTVSALIVLLTMLPGGCAPMTEDERLERQDRLNLAIEDYARMEQVCRRAGGAMKMSTTPLGKFDYHDYKSARCVTVR
jgi:hypothetical protein